MKSLMAQVMERGPMTGLASLEKISIKAKEDISLSVQRQDPKNDKNNAHHVGAKSTPHSDH